MATQRASRSCATTATLPSTRAACLHRKKTRVRLSLNLITSPGVLEPHLDVADPATTRIISLPAERRAASSVAESIYDEATKKDINGAGARHWKHMATSAPAVAPQKRCSSQSTILRITGTSTGKNFERAATSPFTNGWSVTTTLEASRFYALTVTMLNLRASARIRRTNNDRVQSPPPQRY